MGIRIKELLLNVLLRMILGTIVIYFVNDILIKAGILLKVGINPATVLISGILGFPGLAGLYALGIYKLL